MISIYMLSLKWMRMIRGENCRFRSKIEKQSSENSALKSEIKKILHMNAFTIRLKQGMSLQNDNVKVVRSNGEAKN